MTARSMLPVMTMVALAAVPLPARAQHIPAACQPMIDAQRKAITTPHHLYATQVSARPGETPRTSEAISANGVTYFLLNGKWTRSPMTTKAALEQLSKNLSTATVFSCQHVGDESVAGTPAAVYAAHTEIGGVKTDARTWVATGTGLVLRTEDDADTGMGGKQHISIRYDYANVHAPVGTP
jgi:hypothetical protein